MPYVNGKKFSYDKKGIAAAEAAAKKAKDKRKSKK